MSRLQKLQIILLLILGLSLGSSINASIDIKLTNSSEENAKVKNYKQKVDLKPFRANSFEQIIASRVGKAFIMVLWSIDCPPCIKEFEYYQALKNQFTETNIVFISTDSPDNSALIERLLIEHQLQNIDSWIFSDSLPERLRYKIDPNWYGELPRTYFYDANHKRKAHSGIVTQAQLQQWLEKHTPLVSLK
jgi:thiol-disulfide isomerase/thioredoxin